MAPGADTSGSLLPGLSVGYAGPDVPAHGQVLPTPSGASAWADAPAHGASGGVLAAVPPRCGPDHTDGLASRPPGVVGV